MSFENLKFIIRGGYKVIKVVLGGKNADKKRNVCTNSKIGSSFFYIYLNLNMSTKEALPPFGHAIAGSAGTMFAATVVYPLDM
jgi:hypothetical protein